MTFDSDRIYANDFPDALDRNPMTLFSQDQERLRQNLKRFMDTWGNHLHGDIVASGV